MQEAELTELKWFAARVVDNRAYVNRYLEVCGIETARIADIPSLIFIHSNLKRIQQLRYDEFRGYVMFYRKADTNYPEAVKEGQMKTCLLLAPFHNLPVFYLPVDDPSLLEGPRKRVVNGEFKGAEGYVKRIKGTKRLIIPISSTAAIATPYIPARDMEDIL